MSLTIVVIVTTRALAGATAMIPSVAILAPEAALLPYVFPSLAAATIASTSKSSGPTFAGGSNRRYHALAARVRRLEAGGEAK